MRYTLRFKTHFDAAHYIKDYQGKCAREHGHRWEVELALVGSRFNNLNILIDFSDVKRVVASVVDECLDHRQLNDVFNEPNLTAEFLAEWLYRQMRARFTILDVVSVTVWESPDCSITYGN